MAEYTPEQFWKLYEKLPEELKDTIFSADTADHIWDICERNAVTEKVSDIAKYAGHVLLGVLLPEDFQRTLEKEVGLKKDTAKTVAHEVNRFVFWPVKETLRQLHSTEVGAFKAAPSAKEVPSPSQGAETATSSPSAPQGQDTYREAIE